MFAGSASFLEAQKQALTVPSMLADLKRAPRSEMEGAPDSNNSILAEVGAMIDDWGVGVDAGCRANLRTLFKLRSPDLLDHNMTP